MFADINLFCCSLNLRGNICKHLFLSLRMHLQNTSLSTLKVFKMGIFLRAQTKSNGTQNVSKTIDVFY